MSFYTRRLPHWHPPDAEFFVTWRLYGSLPKSSSGPMWLKTPEVAERVAEVLIEGMSKWGFYELHEWVVMGNHVHVLVRPLIPLHKALMNVKSGSARAANAILGRTGTPFWQVESYDHWVRDERERTAIIRYIHNNPVSAGLVEEPGDWPWSSVGWAVGQRTALPYGRLK